MERDRLVRLNWRLGIVAGVTLLLGPVLRFLLSYTGAIIKILKNVRSREKATVTTSIFEGSL